MKSSSIRLAATRLPKQAIPKAIVDQAAKAVSVDLNGDRTMIHAHSLYNMRRKR